jgi:four helix bundle protein
MGYYKDLIVYKKAYELAVEIFIITKRFPKEEFYSLVNQIRRSSRSVCANLAEAYRRREYRDHFLSKLKDCESENSETQIWLDFSRDFGYINADDWIALTQKNDEVGKLLWHMHKNPDSYRPADLISKRKP